MLATLATKAPEGPGWAWELKWDGIRAAALTQDGALRLWTRNGNEISGRYPELDPLADALDGHAAMLDGEIVTFDDQGRPSFERLQRRMHVQDPHEIQRLAVEVPVVLIAFDLLWLDGHLTTGLPYRDRRRLLTDLVPDGPSWRVPAHELGDGHTTQAISKQFALEGIVAKRVDSVYEPGRRSSAWLKVKNLVHQEFVVGGWAPGKGSRSSTFGALLLGYYDDAGVVPVRRTRRHRLHLGHPRPASGQARAARPRHDAVRRPAREPRRPSVRCTSSSRDSSPRSASPNGPPSVASAIRRSSACATTRTPRTSPATRDPASLRRNRS